MVMFLAVNKNYKKLPSYTHEIKIKYANEATIYEVIPNILFLR